jgi:chromosome segregation ATPase
MLGRASDVETFVANGEKDGRIEIEIADDSGNNTVISRIIRREGSPKSTFQLNGHSSTAKKIQELVLKTYHISVNNLCTFLPQDKVGSFSGFDSKQLLIETEKSLSASQHLWHTHQALIEAQDELRSGNSNVDTLKERLDQLITENQRLEREKQRMEEREIAVEQANLFRQKLHWLRFDETREECKTIKENRTEVKRQRVQLKEELEPLQKEHTTLSEARNQLETRYKALNQQTQKLQKEMEKQVKKYETHDDGIENALSELQAMDSQRARLEQEVGHNRGKVTQLENLLESMAPKEQVEREWEECHQERTALVPRYEEARREHRQKQGEHREIQENLKHAQGKWNKLQDDKTQRRDRIFRQQPKMRQVYDWIQDNRQLFRKEVIGPIACEITSKSKNAAAYLEMHVSNATLKSFVVQSKEDYDLLYQNVRVRMKLPVNIINISSLSKKPRMYSNAKLEILKREHGVTGYMDESFSAPDLVIEALKKSANIEKVLIGTDKTQESIDNKNLLDFLGQPEDGSRGLQSCCIFSSERDRSFRTTSTISRFGNHNAALKVDDVRPAKWLAPGVSEEVKQKVSDDLQTWKEKEQEFLPAVRELEAKVAEAQQEAQNATTRLGVAKDNVTNVTKYHNKIKNAQRKLKESEDALSTDDDEKKQKFISVLKNRVAHSITALEAHAECHKQMMQATYKSAGVRINKDGADAKERHVRYDRSWTYQSISAFHNLTPIAFFGNPQTSRAGEGAHVQ